MAPGAEMPTYGACCQNEPHGDVCIARAGGSFACYADLMVREDAVSRSARIVALLAALPACGDEPDAVPPTLDDGIGCAADEVSLPDGSCIAVGVPADRCAPGFSPDASAGCLPILPDEACAAGTMALPGETQCREIGACGEGVWGDISVDSTTEFVDGAYVRSDSDGSAARPWVTMQEGVEAAAAGAIVAVAAGSYAEDVDIVNKAVRLWGRCARMVEIVGQGGFSAVFVQRAAGTEVRGVSVRGPTVGVAVTGAGQTLVEQSWVHDTASVGLYTSDQFGSAAVHVRQSLFESTHDIAVFAYGAELTIEESTVRDTGPDANGLYGRGIAVQASLESGKRASGALRRLVVERNGVEGVFLAAADATVDGIVVRDTLGQPAELEVLNGVGISIGTSSRSGDPASVVVERSVVQRNGSNGVLVCGSDVTIEASVIEDTRALPQLADVVRGVTVQDVCDSVAFARPSTLVLRASLVRRNAEVGVLSFGSVLTLERTLIRGGGASVGRGVESQPDKLTGAVGTATIRESLVEGANEVGVGFFGATGSIERSVVRDTAVSPLGGYLGDAVSVGFYSGAAKLSVLGCALSTSARAGASNFGATLELSGTQFDCNTINLNGEVGSAVAPSFADLGGNACGCGEQVDTCVAQSSNLSAPEPLREVP